jgi:hypothetical protein
VLSVSAYAGAKGVSISSTDTAGTIPFGVRTKGGLTLDGYINDFDQSFYNKGIPRMSVTIYDPTVSTWNVNGVIVPMDNCEVSLVYGSPVQYSYSDECNIE